MRPEVTPSESEQHFASYAFATSGLSELLSAASINMPGERQRIHRGYVPHEGTTSGDYSSGFYLQGRLPIKPAPDAKDQPVVFLVGPNADLPDVALGLQASGKGAIVAEGSFNEEGVVSTQIVELPGGLRAQIRLGELIYADGASILQPNVTVPVSAERGQGNKALQAAMRLAKTGKFPPVSQTKLSEQATSQPDKTYGGNGISASRISSFGGSPGVGGHQLFFPLQRVHGRGLE